jgi:integrase
MIPGMRLFQHRDTWYVYHKGKRISLKTKDKRLAKGIFAKMQKEYLHGEARIIDKQTSVKLSEFLVYYNAAADRQDLSKETQKSIKSAINSLIRYAGDIPVSAVTKEVIDRYKLDAQQDLKPSSINSYILHFNAALNYAVRQGIISEHTPFAKIKTGTRQRRVILPEDLDKLMVAANPNMLRIIHVALWTGARRSELINMRYEHKTGGMIRIIGKGDKERSVPMVGKAREILSQQDIGRVFPSWTHPVALSTAFGRLATKAGVKARLHDLRHTAATTMLAKGVMLSVVQKILGHSSISTTQIYADVLEQTLMDEMKKMEETK